MTLPSENMDAAELLLSLPYVISSFVGPWVLHLATFALNTKRQCLKILNPYIPRNPKDRQLSEYYHEQLLEVRNVFVLQKFELNIHRLLCAPAPH